ncbi:MAG: glycosylase [Ruminococcaceae bacterium]|nr:glycosylase [Oscillospiraceae bacterium]
MLPFKTTSLPASVPPEVMEQTYNAIKTPVKYGAVMKLDNDWTDSPTVFRKDGMFYMYFISISKDTGMSGYETHMARSSDLKNWEYVGAIFRRNDLNRWDSKQCAGYAAYPSIDFEGACELEQVAGAYHISYLAGNSDGYEPDPLYMGLARSEDPTNPNAFTRFPEPILRPEDPDSRPFENKTLYKSFLFFDEAHTTGYPYVNIYNAKGEDNRERIFLAVSEDGEYFERYGDRAVLDLIETQPGTLITGDPQIVKMGDLYVMLFFRFNAGSGAFDTFACSYDLVHWTVWDGEPLVAPTLEWENVHAHKPWFIRHEGVNYHFYCAVNTKGERFIALAHS